MIHHRTTTLQVILHYNPSQVTETSTKETMNASEESILTQTLALLPPLLIFGKTKCFDTDVINGTGIDTAQYNDFVMPMYSLIEYSDNYSKT